MGHKTYITIIIQKSTWKKLTMYMKFPLQYPESVHFDLLQYAKTHYFTTFYHKFTRVVDLYYIAKNFAVKCFTMFCCFYNYVSKHFIFNDATKFCVITKIFWIYISYLTPLNFIANHIYIGSCVVIIDKVLLTRETTFRSFFAQKFD